MVDAIAVLLKMIAKREGIGDILPEEIGNAAEKWNLEDMAVYVKGLEPPCYDPRVLKGSGLAFDDNLLARFYKINSSLFLALDAYWV